MASAVEMLSGEKNRLPVWLRNWPYSSMANALLPRVASARSEAAVVGTSAARKATGRTRQVRSNDISGFMHIPTLPQGLRGQPPLSLPIEYATKCHKTSVGEKSRLHSLRVLTAPPSRATESTSERSRTVRKAALLPILFPLRVQKCQL